MWGEFFTFQTFQTIVWILFWFKSFSSEWNLRWLWSEVFEHEVIFCIVCIYRKNWNKKSIFPASVNKFQKYLLLWTWAKKIIYRPTDPLHFSTVGLRQTNNFLRTAALTINICLNKRILYLSEINFRVVLFSRMTN